MLASGEREAEMLVQCCICGRIRKGKEWLQMEALDVTGEDTSHGYCPVCAARAFDEIRAFNRSKLIARKHAVAS